MNAFKSGWFTEIGAPKGDNFAVAIKVDKVLHEEQSKYQKICIFENQLLGTCLALDDAIQCSTMDEFSYQEMISFIPLNIHPKPAKVLIIGGGDGGVARECLKHPDVERLVQCEIDERVVELSKKYFPSMASSYSNPRLELIIGDGYEYIKQLPDESFDVIITDSSDPKGPAECLFQRPYYELLERKLTNQGIIACQAESVWFDLEFIAKLMEVNRSIYKQVAYASIITCTYPGGQIGFMIASKDPHANLRSPAHIIDHDKLNLKYYRKETHEAAFVLPTIMNKKIYGK